MKKRIFRITWVLVLPMVMLSLGLSAQDAFREIKGDFDVKKGATLNCDIRYSEMEILNWDQDRVDVLAEITVGASSQSKAEARLDKIDVVLAQSGQTVSIETELEEGWSNNAKVKIRIIVKAPSYMNLEMETSYGDLYVQELNGLVNLEMKYGNLKAGVLDRGKIEPYNSLELAYSDASIEKSGWVEMELAYSDVDIRESSMIFCESKYSKLMGEKTGGIITEGAYDKYAFEEVGNFVGELKYSGVKFGILKRKMEVEAKYTHVRINKLEKDFKEVYASLSYGNLYIDVEDGASYKLDAETRYGNLKVGDEGNMSKTKENSVVRMWGNVGSSPKSAIKAETRYGNLEIY